MHVAARRVGLCLVAFLAIPAAWGQNKEISGKVVDARGKPVAGALLATRWSTDGSRLVPVETVTTNADGEFSGKIWFYNQTTPVMVLDNKQRRGDITVVEPNDIDKPLKFTLTDLVLVKAQVDDKALPPGEATFQSGVWVPGRIQLVNLGDVPKRISIRLPAGKYELLVDREDARGEFHEFTVGAGKKPVDLGKIVLKPTKVATYYGKQPPALEITEARGAAADVKLSDYKGKWVVVEFWGFWCNPCVNRSLPHLIELDSKYANLRDHYAILAVHTRQAKTLEELDRKLADKEIAKKHWNGQPLPFPILLDGDDKTSRAWDIIMFPTLVLIDPQGQVVKAGSDAQVMPLFEAELEKLAGAGQ